MISVNGTTKEGFMVTIQCYEGMEERAVPAADLYEVHTAIDHFYCARHDERNCPLCRRRNREQGRE